jgi:hypothetical protein
MLVLVSLSVFLQLLLVLLLRILAYVYVVLAQRPCISTLHSAEDKEDKGNTYDA